MLYVKWCAAELAHFVDFDKMVVEVCLTDPRHPGTSDLTVKVVSGATEAVQEVRTGSLIIADGGIPNWPLLKPHSDYSKVFHSSQTLPRLARLDLDPKGVHCFHIVGSGQSAADIFAYLAKTYPNAKIVMSHRSYAMRPEDDSHFVNELFMPQAVDQMFDLSADLRKKVIRDYWHVTHNGVTIDLLPKLYEMVYYDRVNGQNRFQFNRFSEIVDASESNNAAVAQMRRVDIGTVFEVVADATILATGYNRPCPHPLLAGLSDYLEVEPYSTQYRMQRDYSVSIPGCKGFRVYLQGYSENTHGFSEAPLSLMPERAGWIADGIVKGIMTTARNAQVA